MRCPSGVELRTLAGGSSLRRSSTPVTSQPASANVVPHRPSALWPASPPNLPLTLAASDEHGGRPFFCLACPSLPIRDAHSGPRQPLAALVAAADRHTKEVTLPAAPPLSPTAAVVPGPPSAALQNHRQPHLPPPSQSTSTLFPFFLPRPYILNPNASLINLPLPYRSRSRLSPSRWRLVLLAFDSDQAGPRDSAFTYRHCSSMNSLF